MLILEGVAELENPEHQHQQDRHHERELDHALPAGIGEAPPHGRAGHQLAVPSFFMVDSARRLILPPEKNGRSSGVIRRHS